MRNKDIKAEARRKLAMNMHQAVAIYAIEFVTIIAFAMLIVLSVMYIPMSMIFAIILISYSSIMTIILLSFIGMINFAMVDFYLASYRCRPYNIRRLGDTLARAGVYRIFALSFKRCIAAFFLFILFIVPGIIYLVRTSMAAPLLLANPKMSSHTALKASKKVMGDKSGSYLLLCISFTLWVIVGICTLFVGFIFIAPYMYMSKIVYYKRNLQGDRKVYRVPVQPVSPVTVTQTPAAPPYAAMQFGMPQVREIGQPAAQPAQGSGSPEPSVPPIDTLVSEDIAEMHAAIRDIDKGNEEQQPEVPEVPLTPIQRRRPRKTETEEGVKQVDGSDLVETVKKLSTKEADEADVMSKKIEELFSNVVREEKPAATPDYFFAAGDNPNDFVTNEFDAEDDRGIRTDDGFGVDKPNADPLMSEQDFSDFMKQFDVPETEGEFIPLTRTGKKPAADGDAPAGASGSGGLSKLLSEMLKDDAFAVPDDAPAGSGAGENTGAVGNTAASDSASDGNNSGSGASGANPGGDTGSTGGDGTASAGGDTGSAGGDGTASAGGELAPDTGAAAQSKTGAAARGSARTASTPRTSSRTTARTALSKTREQRVEALRKEREERLKNLKK